MGSDIILYTPCCGTEEHKDLENGLTECKICGNIFPTENLVQEVVDYEMA